MFNDKPQHKSDNIKIMAYEVRLDEEEYFEELTKNPDIHIVYSKETLNANTIDMARGFDGVTTLGQSQINASILNQLKEMNINYISTRTLGYNHIDIEYAKKIGIKVANSPYGSNGVAEFTIMLMLMALRNYKQAMFRGNVNDYSLYGLVGKELRGQTVGVLGSGKIGRAVIDYLSGFRCNILVKDLYQSEEVKEKAKYVDLDTLYRESDIITLHIPYVKENYHIINRESIDKMKDGVVIINCARGELVDVDAIIEGIETKKIGALGLDCIENEEGVYHLDRRTDIIPNKNMAYIRQFPNVIMTQHMAFYTREAVRKMVELGLSNLISFFQTGTCDFEIK